MHKLRVRFDHLHGGDTALIVSTDEGWLEVFYGRAHAVAYASGQRGLTLHLVAQGKQPVAYITNLEVDQSARGKGLGARLVKEAIRILKTKGIETIYLHLYPPSRGFWEKMGFRKYDCCAKDEFEVYVRSAIP